MNDCNLKVVFWIILTCSAPRACSQMSSRVTIQEFDQRADGWVGDICVECFGVLAQKMYKVGVTKIDLDKAEVQSLTEILQQQQQQPHNQRHPSGMGGWKVRWLSRR